MSSLYSSADNWLAIETSTDTLSLALARGDDVWTHTSAGGAQASLQTLPQIQALMAQAGLAFGDLRAVVFGRGPGAFTGLRTACSVAQGLAFGADVPVLPVDTLLALAEEARHAQTLEARVLQAPPVLTDGRVLAVLDARMDQVYVAAYAHTHGGWQCVQEAGLQSPNALTWPTSWDDGESFIAAGNAWGTYAGRWPVGFIAAQVQALPTALALLRLAPQAWAQGLAVPAEQALPLYIRDKVAQTTQERIQAKQQALAANAV
jgi:tRNA threonylcarbamoyladenosine biosynthesis protein TsaB